MGNSRIAFDSNRGEGRPTSAAFRLELVGMNLRRLCAMKKLGRRIFLTLAVVGLFAMSTPSCVIRASVRPVTVVDERPPAPRYTAVRSRAGYVWVRGRWVRRANRWKWRRGRWRRARVGYRWSAGRWESRGARWHWVAGRWTAGRGVGRPAGRVRDNRRRPAAYPVAAPPRGRYVRVTPRAGYVWVRGRYQWRGGRYVWTAGRWQRARANSRWQSGQWVRRGNRQVWVTGRWVAAPRGTVRDHRRNNGTAPPPPRRRNENVPARRGN